MRELALIVSIGLTGLVCAGYVSFAPASRSSEVAALLAAQVRRAVGRVRASSVAWAATLGACVAASTLIETRADGAALGRASAWAAASFAGGAGAALVVHGVSARAVTRTANAVLAGARRAGHDAARAAMAGGVAASLVASTAGLLGLVAVLGGVLAAPAGGGPTDTRLAGAPQALMSFAAGAGVVSLLTVSRGSLVAAGAGALVRAVGDEPHEGPSAEWAACSVATRVGAAVVGERGRFAVLVLTLAGAATCALDVVARNPGRFPNSAGIGAFPALISAFGVLASAAGALTFGLDEHESVAAAFDRGRLITTLSSAVGVAGACRLLVREGWWLYALCGALGLLAAHLACSVSRASVPAPWRALRSIGAPLAALGSAYAIGACAPFAGAGALGAATAAAGLLCPAAYVVALELAASAVAGASSLAAHSGGSSGESRTRIARLAGACPRAEDAAAGYAASVVAAGAFLVSIAAGERAAAHPGNAFGWVAIGAAAALVLTCGGVWLASVGRVERAVRTAYADITPVGAANSPRGDGARSRDCLALAVDHACGPGFGLRCTAVLLAPVAVVTAGRLLGADGALRGGVAAFAATLAVAGGASTLGPRAAHESLGAADPARDLRTPEGAPDQTPGVGAPVVAVFAPLGSLFAALATLTFVVAPLFR